MTSFSLAPLAWWLDEDEQGYEPTAQPAARLAGEGSGQLARRSAQEGREELSLRPSSCRAFARSTNVLKMRALCHICSGDCRTGCGRALPDDQMSYETDAPGMAPLPPPACLSLTMNGWEFLEELVEPAQSVCQEGPGQAPRPAGASQTAGIMAVDAGPASQRRWSPARRTMAHCPACQRALGRDAAAAAALAGGWHGNEPVI